MNGERVQRFGAFVIRLASIAAGGLILKHEVYDAPSAELAVIALGLWLIGVPPALWLDALRRAGRTLDGMEERPTGKDQDDRAPLD